MLLQQESNRIGKAEFKDNKWVINNILDYTADPIDDRNAILKGMQLAGRINSKWKVKGFYLAEGGFVIDTEEEELVYIRLSPKQTEVTQDAISGLALNTGNFKTELNALNFHWVELFKSFLKPEHLELISVLPQNWTELQTQKLGRFGLEIGNIRFNKINKLLAFLWKNRNTYFNTPKKAEFRWKKIKSELYEEQIVNEWFKSLVASDQLDELVNQAKLDMTYWLLTPESLQLMGPIDGKPRSGNWITKTADLNGNNITVSIGFSGGEMCGPLKYQVNI
jgi:hypothetical protein